MLAYDYRGILQKTKTKNKNNIKHLLYAAIKNTKTFKVYSVKQSSLKISKKEKVYWFSHCLHHFMATLCTTYPKTLFGKRHSSKYAKIESLVIYILFTLEMRHLKRII